MRSHIRDTAIGVIVLAAIFPGQTIFPFISSLLVFVARVPPIPPVLNVMFFGAVAIMLLVAAYWIRPGLVLAPPLFAALWATAAIGQRIYIQVREDPTLADRSIPADLRQVQTLTLEKSGPTTTDCCGHVWLLADGLIDRFVHVNREQKIMTAYRLERGPGCSANAGTASDRYLSNMLAQAGRTAQCIRSENVDAIPDGIVIRMHYIGNPLSGPGYPLSMGCCNRGTVSLRVHGDESIRATWFFGRRPALSLLTFFGTRIASAATVPLWSTDAGGPIQPVEIGGPPFRPEDLAAAVYGTEWYTHPGDLRSPRSLQYFQKKRPAPMAPAEPR